jgi:hypothetical protein
MEEARGMSSRRRNLAEREAAALARGVGVTTLMRQIIEDWVRANH